MAGGKTSSSLLAERYISAIFDPSTVAPAKLSAFDAFFSALEALIEKAPSVMVAFANPTASRKTKVALSEDIAGALKAGKEQKNFLALLARNNRLEHLPAIISAFRARYAAHKGEVVLSITTARPAAAASLASIRAAVEKSTGKTTLLKTDVDPSLIGGIVIQFGSTLLDCSLKGKLARLEHSLKQTIANA